MAKFNGPAFCPNCGYEGKPKKVTPGSLAIEIILWICFLVPGIIYSIWRLSSKKIICPSCSNENVIPLSSKMSYLKLHGKA